jgi:hypothetical protein
MTTLAAFFAGAALAAAFHPGIAVVPGVLWLHHSSARSAMRRMHRQDPIAFLGPQGDAMTKAAMVSGGLIWGCALAGAIAMFAA